MSQQPWWKNNSAEDIAEAFQDGTVDAFGDHEQVMSLFYSIAEELEFPFAATLAGDSVSVVGVEQSKVDPLGLDLVCEKSDKRYSVAARSVELTSNLPVGQVFLAAYLDWKSKF